MYIRVGDWSHDGHGQYEDVYISSNYSGTAIVEAYRKTAADIRYDFENGVCAGYEDCIIPEEMIDRLKNLNCDISDLLEEWEDKYNVESSQNLVEIILRMAKVNIPNLVWSYKEDECILSGIGYGLFY